MDFNLNLRSGLIVNGRNYLPNLLRTLKQMNQIINLAIYSYLLLKDNYHLIFFAISFLTNLYLELCKIMHIIGLLLCLSNHLDSDNISLLFHQDLILWVAFINFYHGFYQLSFVFCLYSNRLKFNFRGCGGPGRWVDLLLLDFINSQQFFF